MKNEEKQPEKTVGEMHRQQEKMADGKRYIIFYTFGEKEKPNSEVTENV